MIRLPLIAPNPPRLSEHLDALRRVEASGVFSNNGPEVRAFEAGMTDTLFGGHGACLAVGNATLGLMLAIRHASGMRTGGLDPKQGTLALMPALTFAATAQAAAWAGLTPLVCDIDPDDWGACALEEERLLQRYGERIGVVVPYATFGNAIDLDRYLHFQRRYGVGVVVDAASSLGTLDDAGLGFGARAPFAVVHSMHATKTFAVGEGGLIHSGDVDLIATLRSMGNFGFEGSRNATLPGINAKLPEITAIIAQAKLAEIDAIADHRAVLDDTYRTTLPDFQFQAVSGRRRAMQFMPVLLPEHIAHHRDAIVESIEADGVGCGRYFSPHLGEQPWFQATAMIEPTPVADRIAGRMLSLPITDAMSVEDARRAATAAGLGMRGDSPAARSTRVGARPGWCHRLGYRDRRRSRRDGDADLGDQARSAPRSRRVGADGDRARQRDRWRAARALCDHVGFDRADLPDRGPRQCASRTRAAGRSPRRACGRGA